jgi:hypothetical protein
MRVCSVQIRYHVGRNVSGIVGLVVRRDAVIAD